MNRQHLLLAVLIVIGVVRVGDYVLNAMIQKPLQLMRGENNELRDKIKKGETLLAAARKAVPQIQNWQKQSLPENTEQARSLYRNWLLETIRSAKLRNATVDSGSPKSRSGLVRAMPFNLRCRGTLSQITSALYEFERSKQLHRIVNLRLSPTTGGQFDLSAGVEALILPGTKRTAITQAVSTTLVSSERQAYDVISEDNIFGVGTNQQDPMQTTILSAVTWRNGKPLAWLTEQTENKVYKLPAGTEFETTALAGRVIEVDEKSAVVEISGQQFKVKLGENFADSSPDS